MVNAFKALRRLDTNIVLEP